MGLVRSKFLVKNGEILKKMVQCDPSFYSSVGSLSNHLVTPNLCQVELGCDNPERNRVDMSCTITI